MIKNKQTKKKLTTVRDLNFNCLRINGTIIINMSRVLLFESILQFIVFTDVSFFWMRKKQQLIFWKFL